MGVIPEDFGQSMTKFELIGTQTFGVVVLGHDFGIGVPSTVDGANAVFDSWEAMDVMALLAPEWQLAEVEMTIMTGTGPITGTSTRTAQPGTSASSPNVPQSALLVAKSTNQGGRAGRGRFFLPGLPEAAFEDDGSVSAGTMTLAGTVIGDMIGDFNLNDVSLRLLHSVAGPAPAVVTGLAVRSISATQRRRLRR